MRGDDTWEPDEPLDLRRYWNIVYRRKWSIIGLALTAGVVAALMALGMTPIYRATATVLIESEEANVVSIEEVYGLGTRRQEYFETQFQILRSRPLAERVVNRLALYEHPAFLPKESSSLLPKLNWRTWLPFGQSSAESPSAPPDNRPGTVGAYLARLGIEPVSGTQLVQVHFESPDAELAATIANTHAQAFIESMLDARIDVTESAAKWMAERLDVMRQDLRESEAALQEFREREQLVDVEGLRALPSQEINDLSSRLLDVRQTLAAAEIAYLQVSSVNGATANLSTIPAVMNDPSVRSLQQALGNAEQAVAELSDRYGPEHPRMIAARTELAQATEALKAQRSTVADAIRVRYEGAKLEEASIVAALERAQSEYQDIGRKESELNSLRLAVDTNRQLYDLLYSRLSETAVTGDLQTAQARVVEPAIVATAPSRPNKRRIVMMAVALTLLFGIAVAFLLDSLDNTVKSSADVEEKLRRPMLGMVPLLKGKTLRTIETIEPETGAKIDPRYSEAIRTIRTGISLDRLDNPHKIILVTSAIGAEGKSTVALNLARAFAGSEKTLLIDADLRRPSIGKMLHLPRDNAGLSELLADRGQLQACMQRSGLDNLHVITTGFIPPDPLQLLLSARMRQALKVLAQAYARIVIDSPPILPVSDAAVLSRLADSVVFVVKADATAVSQIKNGIDLLDRVNAPITGIVLNQLDVKKAEKYSDYGYGGYYASYESESSKENLRGSS